MPKYNVEHVHNSLHNSSTRLNTHTHTHLLYQKDILKKTTSNPISNSNNLNYLKPALTATQSYCNYNKEIYREINSNRSSRHGSNSGLNSGLSSNTRINSQSSLSNSKYDISKYSLQRTTSGGSSITSTISNKLSSLKLTKSSDSTLAISNFINDSRPYYEPPLSISRSPKISPKLKLRNMSNSPENNFSGHSSFSHSLPTLANYGNPGTLNLHAGQIEGTTDNSDIKIFYDEHHNMAKVFTPLLDKLKNDMQKKASSSSSSSSTNGAPFDSRESKAAMDTLRLKFEVAHKHIPGIADKILDKLILKMEDFSKHGMSKNVVEYSRQKMPRHYSSSSSGQGSDVQQNQNLTMSLVNSNISGSSHASHHTSSSQHSKSSAYRTSSTQSNSSDHSGSISSSISQSTAGPGFSRNSASFHGVRSKPSLIHSNSYNSSQPQRTYSYKNGGGRTGASGTDERGNTSTSDRIDRLVDRESSGSGSRKIHGHKTLSQSRSDAVYASRTRSLLSRK